MKTNKNNLNRVIVDYKKLDDHILTLLIEKYPYGYGDLDIISFKNTNGDLIECVEVQTEDTLYLVKVSRRLQQAMENFEDEDDNFNNDDFDYFFE